MNIPFCGRKKWQFTNNNGFQHYLTKHIEMCQKFFLKALHTPCLSEWVALMYELLQTSLSQLNVFK